MVIEVAQIGDEDIMQIADDVYAYLEEVRARLPEGLSVAIWTDTSKELVERFSVLNTTAGGGLALVLVILALFLRLRLAMWVAARHPHRPARLHRHTALHRHQHQHPDGDRLHIGARHPGR